MTALVANTTYALVNPATFPSNVSVARAAGQGLLVDIYWKYASLPSAISSVIWDSAGDNQPLVHLQTQKAGAEPIFVSTYYLPAPTSAKTGNISVSFAGTDVWYAAISVRHISGHNPDVVARASVKFTQSVSSSSPVNDSIGSAVGDLVLDAFGARDIASHYSAAGGQANVSIHDIETSAMFSTSTKAGATSTAMGWASADPGTYDSAHIIVSIEPVPGDAVIPTQTGSIAASNITHNSFKLDWPAGADNVAVTGYEYSLNAGTNWTNAGNVLTVTPTGLTPSTAYSVQVRAYDAASNRSTPVLAATVTTTAAPGDSTVPTQAGSITVSNVTSSGFKLTWPAASDNVGVFGYEVSIDGGTSYTNVGSVLTITETGRPASTAHQIRVVAYDAAGNRSTPLSATATTLAATSGTITTDPFKANNGTLRTGLTGLVVAVLDLTTLLSVKNFTGRTTDASTARMTISAPEMVAGSWYAVVTVDVNGVLGVEKYQAS